MKAALLAVDVLLQAEFAMATESGAEAETTMARRSAPPSLRVTTLWFVHYQASPCLLETQKRPYILNGSSIELSRKSLGYSSQHSGTSSSTKPA